jgi:hypothetical protein
MDAGVVDLWWFGTACELLFGERVSSVSHGQHRLARIEGVRTSNPFSISENSRLQPITSTDP